MNVDIELADHKAAGALSEEIPYWGWLEDGRTCLTRAGELLSLARLSPAVLDGRSPEQMDEVLNRWQRMLSGADTRTRIYFYLFRRPCQFEAGELGEQATVAALSQRKRRSFLGSRVKTIQSYVAWTHDPHLSTAAAGPGQSSMVEILPAKLAGPAPQPAMNRSICFRRLRTPLRASGNW